MATKKEDKSNELTEAARVVQAEMLVNEVFADLENMSDGSKVSVIRHILQQIKICDIKDVPAFNLNMLLSATGATKTIRLDELHIQNENRRRGDDPNLGRQSARDIATALINRAVLPDTSQKEDLINVITAALVLFIPDPVQWQNPQKDINSWLLEKMSRSLD